MEDCTEIAARLGIERKGRRWGPCPACRSASTGRGDPRPPLLLDARGWRCLGCDQGGGWGALVSWALYDAPYSHERARDVAAWMQDAPSLPKIAPFSPSQDPGLPMVAPGELAAMTAVMSPTNARAVAYLRERGIWDDDHPPACLSMLAAPAGLPEVEAAGGRMCSIWPWRADVVVGLRDLSGALRSIHARRTWGGPDARPKALYPIQRTRKGLVMMSPGARDGGPCLVVEGITDYLLATTLTPRVIGIGSGSPVVPQAVAVITHPDPPGARYRAPYSGPSAAADLCDLGRAAARALLEQLGVPLWGR